MRILKPIKFLLTALMVLLVQSVKAQNHLVTNNFIWQKVTEGYFIQKPGTTIPQDNFCITKTNAANWLYLDETRLPSDNRMPWWSELIPRTYYIPCPNANFNVCPFSSGVYSSCGSWLYAEGFDVNLNSYNRRQIGPANPLWMGTPADKLTYCNYTPASSKNSLMSLNNVSGGHVTTDTSGSMITNMTLNSFTGPLNRCGIWDCSNAVGVDDWVFVSGTITASSTKTYYIGAAADNFFRIYVDDNLVASYNILDGEAFRMWHVFPVNLTAGLHTIRFEAKNDPQTPTSDAVMGCEVYDNTEAQLDAAQSYSDLNILFTTQGLSNENLCSSEIEYAIYVSVWSGAGCITGIYGLAGYTSPSEICAYDGGIYTHYDDLIYVNVTSSSGGTLILYSEHTYQTQPVYGSGVYSFSVTGIPKADLQINLE